MIVKPLSETQQFAEAVADGDMSLELDVRTTQMKPASWRMPCAR